MHFYTQLVVLSVLLTVVKSMKQFPNYGRQINLTTSQLYNFQTEKCCLGMVHESIKPDYQRCCGADVYDSSKQLCCQGNVLARTSNSACCGSGVINTDQFLCCEDRPVEVPRTDASLISYAKCCGTDSFYDYRSQTCCQTGTASKVLEGAEKMCCGDQLYDQSKEICCTTYMNDSASYSVLPTTGDKDGTEFCCGDKVVKDSGCCDGQTFNYNTSICCNNKDILDKKGKNLDCCGEESFDVDTQICCYDVNGEGMEIVTKTDPNQNSCCGSKLYDYRTQLCCFDNEKIVPKVNEDDYECCGNVSYDILRGLCCSDVLYSNVSSRTHECCYNTTFDPLDKACCGDVVTYDPEKQSCCTKYRDSGEVWAIAVVDNQYVNVTCGGVAVYNSAIRCESRMYLGPPDTPCCGDKPYDYEKEVCCSGQVFPKQSDQDICCTFGTTDETPQGQFCYPYAYA